MYLVIFDENLLRISRFCITPTTIDESIVDPSIFQTKHQKHKAFKVKLAANTDRIQVQMEESNTLNADFITSQKILSNFPGESKKI